MPAPTPVNAPAAAPALTPAQAQLAKLEADDKAALDKFSADAIARRKLIDDLNEKARVEKDKADYDKMLNDNAAATKAASDKAARIAGNPTSHALSEVAAALRGKGHQPWMQEHFNAAADQLDARADQISSAGHAEKAPAAPVKAADAVK